MKLRSLLVVLAVALTGAPTLAADASSAPHHVAASAAPAAPVQAGSYLAVLDRTVTGKSRRPDIQRLVLVTPRGETTTVYERRVSRTYGGFALLDWSVDGRTALLTAINHKATQLIRVDVETGAVSELPVKLLNSAVLDPDGTGVLATVWKRRSTDTVDLDRISWDGHRTRLREGVGGSLIAGRDGTVVVVGQRGRRHYVLSTADGSVRTTFRGHGRCTMVRWWDATHLLASCGNRPDLYLIDPATDTSTQLTDEHRTGDYGHVDGRVVGGRLYVQVFGDCGATYVGRQTRSGAVKRVRVPGVVGNVLLVDAVGDDLVLERTAGCDGPLPRTKLTVFDPVDRTETPLLVLRRNRDLGRVLVMGETRVAWY